MKNAIFLIAILILAPSPTLRAEPLAAPFQSPVSGKKQKKKESVPPVPHDYAVYLKGKSALGPKGGANLEGVQREVLLAPLASETRSLEKELEDQFYALELRRGVQLAKKRLPVQALNAFSRGLNGLTPYKWIYFWGEDASQALSKICLRNKKKKDEDCLALAKRVAEAFPKAANETKVLRELPALDPIPASEMYGERLSQSYSEKVEKDEEAFQEVLDDYLMSRDTDLLRSAKEFISDYPKSSLRFRATFLIAESHRRNHRDKEAQPYYLSLIEQVPLSYYSIVSSERLQINLRERVKKDALDVNLSAMNPNLIEKLTLARAKTLFLHQLNDEVGIELDFLSRPKNYNNHMLLYVMKLASVSQQNLVAFKIANELIQRKFDRLLNAEFIDLLFPDRFQKEIEAQAAATGLDPLLIASLMKQESGFKANAISSSGALGLMQLMPFTAIDTKKDLLLSTLKDPATNIQVGSKYLQGLYEKYEGNIPYSLAAYNAGPHRVAKWKKESRADWSLLDWIEAIPYKETREYVTSILRNRYWYQYRKNLPATKITEMKL